MSSLGNLPPATPAYILRGHRAPVHALQFYNHNNFLISGDSEGWIVIWSLASKRSVACWKAHEGSILGIKEWKQSVITHGRDHKLRVWQLTEYSFDGKFLDPRLPIEAGGQDAPRKEPWLLHSTAVSALNFCAFSLCTASEAACSGMATDEAFVAVPNALDSGSVDFFHLPLEKRVSILKADPKVKTGMIMALDLFHRPETGLLTVISGYEDGHTMVHQRESQASSSDRWVWVKTLMSRPHSQPILSLGTMPSKDFYFTSSADAVIAKFAIPISNLDSAPSVPVRAAKINNTKHAGQQDLTVRNDGKIFATAGWDARIRVYSCKTLRELAVLKWHEDGCYSITFAEVLSPSPSKRSEEKEERVLVASPKSDESALEIIKYQRSLKAQQTHWLAAGGKDGKISLWDIY